MMDFKEALSIYKQGEKQRNEEYQVKQLQQSIEHTKKRAEKLIVNWCKFLNHHEIDWTLPEDLDIRIDMVDDDQYFTYDRYRILIQIDDMLLMFIKDDRGYTDGFQVFEGHCPDCKLERWSLPANNFLELADRTNGGFGTHRHTCPDIEEEVDKAVVEAPISPTWQEKLTEAFIEAMSETYGVIER